MKFKFDKELPRIKRVRKTTKISELREIEVVVNGEVVIGREQVGREQSRQVEEASQGQINLGGDGGYSGELEEY